jgi:hypothetical protein
MRSQPSFLQGLLSVALTQGIQNAECEAVSRMGHAYVFDAARDSEPSASRLDASYTGSEP